MNFYQVPSLKPGKTIHQCYDILGFSDLLTRLRSAETVKQVIRILDPRLVIVTAKKEFNEIADLSGYSIIRCTHPSCSWWNRPHGAEHKRGYEYLSDAIEQYLK